MKTKLKFNFISILIILTFANFGYMQESGSVSSDVNTARQVGPKYITDNYLLESFECRDLIPIEEVAQDIFPDPNVQCAYLWVPENYDDPNSAMIKLAIYFFPATTQTPAAAPVIYLEGGPGGNAVSVLPQFANGGYAFLREYSDVIVFDQRGTGYSKPFLGCMEIELADNELDGARACHQRLVDGGVNLAYFNSYQNAKDVQNIRKTLGYSEANLFGVSYGTRLALTVLRDSPEGIRSVILDSAFPPQINGLSEQPESTYYAFDKIVEICNSDAKCHAKYPNLKEDIIKGILRLRAQPVGEFDAAKYIETLTKQMANSDIAANINLVANGSDEELKQLADSLAAAEEQDSATTVAELVDYLPLEILQELLPIVGNLSQGMGDSVVCQEEYPFMGINAFEIDDSGWEEVKGIIDEISLVASGFSPTICAEAWRVPKANVREIFAVKSEVPGLVLAGEADVATPPAWSKLAAKGLVNSQFVEFPSYGHGVVSNDCPNNIVFQFLNNPNAELDQSCIADIARIEYK